MCLLLISISLHIAKVNAEVLGKVFLLQLLVYYHLCRAETEGLHVGFLFINSIELGAPLILESLLLLVYLTVLYHNEVVQVGH